VLIFALIFGRGNRAVFWGFVWLEKGELEADFYDGEWNPGKGEKFSERGIQPRELDEEFPGSSGFYHRCVSKLICGRIKNISTQT